MTPFNYENLIVRDGSLIFSEKRFLFTKNKLFGTDYTTDLDTNPLMVSELTIEFDYILHSILADKDLKGHLSLATEQGNPVEYW